MFVVCIYVFMSTSECCLAGCRRSWRGRWSCEGTSCWPRNWASSSRTRPSFRWTILDDTASCELYTVLSCVIPITAQPGVIPMSQCRRDPYSLWLGDCDFICTYKVLKISMSVVIAWNWVSWNKWNYRNVIIFILISWVWMHYIDNFIFILCYLPV